MVELRGENLLVRLAGAAPADFAAALAEQGELVRRAILEAGFTAGQAWLTAECFEAAAQAACGRT